MEQTVDTNQEFFSEYRRISEEERRTLIENYFYINHAEFPSLFKGHILLAYIGAAVGFILIFYLKKAIPTMIFSISAFIFAFWHFYRWIVPWMSTKRFFAQRPNETQMAQWLVKDLKEVVKPCAIDMLSLNMEDIRPENFIIIPVPVYWETPGVESSAILRQQNSDSTFIYSVWKVQILVLSKYYVSLFTCLYNWIENTMTTLMTNEFYFADITSISNDIQPLNYQFINNPDMPVGTGRIFHVSNKAGDSITVLNDIPSLKMLKKVSVNLEHAVSLIRWVLRNRRFGVEKDYVEPVAAPEKNKKPQDVHSFDIQSKGALYSDDNHAENDEAGNSYYEKEDSDTYMPEDLSLPGDKK